MSGAFPVNIGPGLFFEASVAGCPLAFCPGIYSGPLRGTDVLDSGEVTFGTAGDYKNTVFSEPIDGMNDAQAGALAFNVEVVCLGADICSVPNLQNMSMNTYERRTAEVLYSGGLFFQDPNIGDAEMLDHDVLDSVEELTALIALLGVDSDAGLALAPFADNTGPAVPTVSQWGMVTMALTLLALGTTLTRRRRPAAAL